MRSAFILNENAKSVRKGFIEEIKAIVPKEDLFISKTINDSENHIRNILKKGYVRIFSGGGDGTAINTINTMIKLVKKHKIEKIPAVGVLRLGTGNALASVLMAKKAIGDIRHIVNGGELIEQKINMIKCDNGQLTPFAGVGCDGDLVNRYSEISKKYSNTPLKYFINTVVGYFFVGITQTLPKYIRIKNYHYIKIYSKFPSYKIVNLDGTDIEELIPANSLIYEGNAATAVIGSIDYFGYGLKMFPFASRKPGFVHLRVSALGPISTMFNLYPKIWNGTFRNKLAYDFLIKEAEIESANSLPYQASGDPKGYKKKIKFSIAKEPIKMTKLPETRIATFKETQKTFKFK